MGIADFGAVLRHFRRRAGLSQNALATLAGINASYINRVERRQRAAPRRHVVLALARALTLSQRETDCCYLAAGLAPPSLQRLSPADSTVAALLGVLTDEHASPAALADFRAVVETLCSRWQRQGYSRQAGAVPAPSSEAPPGERLAVVAVRRRPAPSRRVAFAPGLAPVTRRSM